MPPKAKQAIGGPRSKAGIEVDQSRWYSVPDELLLFRPQPGMQVKMLIRPEFEVFAGGAKGPGKSYGAIGWLIKGNPHVHRDKKGPFDISYINHPKYRALALRKNSDDLNAWIEEAKPIYTKLGAVFTKQPSEFTFPSGAKIVLGHLHDEDAFERYSGQPVQRIFIDEVTYIASFKLYEKIKSCCRSTYPELIPQMLLTGNPEGPGIRWVEERFIDARDAEGRIVPPETTIYEEKYNPILKQVVKQTRVYIPGRITDNKKLLESDPMYYTRLDTMEEPHRSAYLFGDWKAVRGGFFREFRPDGPRAGEPPEARHVVPEGSIPIMPWWPRLLAMDIGYKHHSVVLKAAVHPNGQLIAYDELCSAGVENEEWGAQIARWCIKDLEGLPHHQMTLWLSHDAFGHRGDPKTRAEQVEAGVRKILGPTAACLLGQEEMQEQGKDFFDRLEFQRAQAKILIRPAPRQRVDGWQYLRGLMRFKPLLRPAMELFDPVYAQQLLDEDGATRYFEYLKTFQEAAPEVLPRILFTSKCKVTIAAIPTAVYDVDGPNPEDVLKTETVDDDALDCVRYLAMGYKHSVEKEPIGVYADRKLAAALKQNPNLDGVALMQIREKAFKDYESLEDRHVPFSIGRGSPRTHGLKLM